MTPDGSALLIELSYRVRATNSTQNLVYPFYLRRRASNLTGPDTAPPLDERDAPAFAAALRALAAGDVPQWRPGQQGADAAMLQIVAHQLQAIARRLNQAPDKNKLAFLDLAGVSLVTAQPAARRSSFELADNATDLRLPPAPAWPLRRRPAGPARSATRRKPRSGWPWPSCARW